MLFLSDVMNNSGTQFIAFVFLVKPYLDIDSHLSDWCCLEKSKSEYTSKLC